MSKLNFAGQTVRRANVEKLHDLQEADFSGARLGGVDLRGKKLDGAKFCGARMGRAWDGELAAFGSQLGLGVLGGLLFAVGLVFMWVLADDKHNLLTKLIGTKPSMFLLLVLAQFSPCLALHLRQPIILLLGFATLFGTALITGAGAVAVAVALAVFLSEKFDGVWIIAFVSTYLVSQFLYWRLAQRALHLQEPHLLWLRNLALFFSSAGCCRFSQTIRHADFSNADFKRANLQNCEFLRCHFHAAKNLHLAITSGTILDHRAVRELLAHGQTTEKNFSHLDLHGASFAGMDLQGVDFSNSNLAGCDFSTCPLQGANFSHANVTGVDFSGADLTGVIIENWNIDAQTRFTGVKCDFVWLEQKKTTAGRERNPPQEGQNFQPGEFAKLYQQVSETISFILHNRTEEAAFALALSKLHEEGKTTAQILSLEQKGDSTVVKLGLPPQAERELEYTQILTEMQQQQTQIALLEGEQQRLALAYRHLETENRVLAVSKQHLEDETRHNRNLLNLLAGRAIQFQQEIAMGNEYKIINKGDHNAIAQGPHARAQVQISHSANPELAALLQELQSLLATCQLPAADAKEAADTLARVQTEHQGEKTRPGSAAGWQVWNRCWFRPEPGWR